LTAFGILSGMTFFNGVIEIEEILRLDEERVSKKISSMRKGRNA